MGQGDVSSPGDSYPNSVEIMSTKEPEKGRIPTEGEYCGSQDSHCYFVHVLKDNKVCVHFNM